MIQFLQIFR